MHAVLQLMFVNYYLAPTPTFQSFLYTLFAYALTCILILTK